MSTFSRIMRRLGILVLVGLVLIVVGAMIGYGVGGGNPFAVFVPSTWTHILDFLR